MDLNDVFEGNFPGRPDHPDFWKLSEVLLHLDGSIEDATTDVNEKERIWREEVQKHVDVDSLGYVALQRALRVLGISSAKEVILRINEVTPQMQMFIDAFIIGCNFKETT